jgi:anti-anti-sigma regulatory factor
MDQEHHRMQSGTTPTTVVLSGSLTIERASALKKELVAALEEGDTILLNVSAVDEIDLSCLQLLYSAKASAGIAGKNLNFAGSVPLRIARRLASCGFLHGASERPEDLDAALSGY